MSIRELMKEVARVCLVGLLVVVSNVEAQTVSVDPGYLGEISGRNVGGGLSHLPDGDLLAFSSDFANGSALQRMDANGDGHPVGGVKVLAQFTSSTFPSFVQVAPGGTFALVGVTGGTGGDRILRVDLLTDTVQPYATVPGNYDLVFIDDTKAYLSANPQGFDQMGPNRISLLELTPTPIMTTVVELFGTPSGPLALNTAGDLYYISSTFQFPAPPMSSTLLRFSASDLAMAFLTEMPLDSMDAVRSLVIDGGYDIAFRPLNPMSGELYVSDFSNELLRIDEDTLTPDVFLSVADPDSPGLTGLSLYRPSSFTASGPTQSELAISLALDFFATNALLQVRPTTYVALDPAPTDEFGFCRADELDCLNQPLEASACVGANGFLSQINIASVVNLQVTPLVVTVQYFNSAGTLVDSVTESLQPDIKRDYLINELGLAPNTIGTVCVLTNAADRGAWTGGIALYKPDLRNGPSGFGDGFDFALYYPFLNAFRAPVTVSLNTFHLGTDPAATVANWVSIADAERDGLPLTGRLIYFDEVGAVLSEQLVVIGDGARQDFAGHVGIGGANNSDAIGMAQFIPNSPPGTAKARYYLTITRYFYDCPGSGCSNFRAAFNLPYRPGTSLEIFGGASTIGGEISIVELNNVSTTAAQAAVGIFAGSSASLGNLSVPVPSRATRHLILNRVGQSGFVPSNSVATASARAQTGVVSATSLFYKLGQFGELEYAYAAPLVGSPGARQLAQYNSFIMQANVPELFNSGTQSATVDLQFISYTGQVVAEQSLQLLPKATARLSQLSLPGSDYGTLAVESNRSGVVARNHVIRPGQYTLAFGGQ